MNFNFPNSPIEGQTFQPVGGPAYVWHAPTWDLDDPDLAVVVVDGQLLYFDTQAVFAASIISPSVNHVQLAGYYAVGDGGGHMKKRAGIPSAGPGKSQSGDGSWWEIAETSVSPRMFGAKGDGVADDAAAVESAAQAAMDSHLTLLARGTYKLGRQISNTYAGFLQFDLRGAKFIAGPGFTGTAPVWTVAGGTATHGTFWWEGGFFNGEALPALELGGIDFLNISTADSASVVHLHVEEIYTGEDWRTAGGDSHIITNGSRVDVYIGNSQGAVDLGVYHTSSSNTTTPRREFFRLRGNFKKCYRAAKASRGSTVLDVEISSADCAYGWVGSAIDVGGLNFWSDRTGHVKVVATRTGYPVSESRSFGIKFDVVATDGGVYLPAGAAAEVVSSASRCEFRGVQHCTGSISWHGINPDVVAHGHDPLNFGALDVRNSDATAEGGDIVQSQNNFFQVHCTGGGRIILERDGSTDNHYFVRSDIVNVTLLGTSSIVRFGHPMLFQDISATGISGTAVTQSAKDTTAGRLTKVGDFGLGAALNLGSGDDLDTIPPCMFGNSSSVNVPANVPVVGSIRWAGIHIQASTTQAIQICARSSGADAVYYRRNDSGVWSAWAPFFLPPGGTFTGKVTFKATALAAASFTIPSGNAPTTPVDGDVWLTSGGSLQIRVAGVTKTVTLT